MRRSLFSIMVIFCFLSCNSPKEKTPVQPQIKTESKIQKDTETKFTKKEKVIVSDSLIPKIEEKVVDLKRNSINKTNLSTKQIIEKKKAIPKEINPTIKKKKNEVKETKNEVLKKEASKVDLRPKHDLWNTLTKNHVSSNGKVNYKAFKTNLTKVETYLKELENFPPNKNWSKNEKLAYWFNLYNASTVYLVASNYPINSIKNINNGKPWDKKFIKSGTNIYSLNEIENIIVRPNYNEPRLHVAFNCAAVSCPNLLNAAFTSQKLDRQLNSLAKKWINDSSKNTITEKEIKISKIFDWYKIDFKKGIISFINTYSTTQAPNDVKITYQEYNWDLND